MISNKNIGAVYLLYQHELSLDGMLGAPKCPFYYDHYFVNGPIGQSMLDEFTWCKATNPMKKAKPIIVLFLGIFMLDDKEIYKLIHNGLIQYGLAEEFKDYMELI